MSEGYLLYCREPHTSTGECPAGQLAEIKVDMDSFQSPWNLSIEEASQIGTAIVAVWAVAFAYRTVVRFLNQSDSEESS